MTKRARTKKPADRHNTRPSLWPALRPVAASMLLAALVFGVVTSLYPRLPVIHDAYGYTMTAQRLAYHGVLSFSTAPPDEQLTPSAFVTPGYPLFLSVFYAALGDRSTEGTVTAEAVQPVVQRAQFLLALGIVGLIAGCGLLLGGERLSYVAGILAAFYLPFAWSATVALSECLGAFLAALQLLLAIKMTGTSAHRTWWLFGAFGVVSAALGLVRPALVLWTVAPIIYLLVLRMESPRRLLMLTGVALAGFGLLMVPWWVRNAVVLDQFIPLSTGAGNPMLIASGGDTLSPAEQQVADRAQGEGRDPFVAAARFRMAAQFKSNPGVFLQARAQLMGLAVSQPWIAPSNVLYEEIMHYDVARVAWGEQYPKQLSATNARAWSWARVYQWFLLVAAAVSLVFMRRSPRLVLVATIPLYVAAVHSLTLFIDRYFFPAMPSVIVLAAAGVYGLWHSARRRLRSAG
jgi:hypothetical protein